MKREFHHFRHDLAPVGERRKHFRVNFEQVTTFLFKFFELFSHFVHTHQLKFRVSATSGSHAFKNNTQKLINNLQLYMIHDVKQLFNTKPTNINTN